MNAGTPAASRAGLRAELRARRRAIPAAQRIAAAEQLAERLLALPILPPAGDVAGYWAMDGEIALHAVQLRLPPGLRWCLPVLAEDGLRFARWRPGEPLAPNRHGIPEPAVPADALLEPRQMALVLVPLVGFDAAGHRLGMGGGWYDRAFAYRNGAAQARDAAGSSGEASRRPPWLVGTAFAAQQVEALAAEAWDVPLDAVCTERETFLLEAS
ncbi:MAG TPA: 5-formyltetrahydrofolate cyclo-ligase [Luteimonas sp.]|jgi:5-formyltetrahydrofolate cyclo-ligase|nr:5-formyltetrahydrofolate cyclo-ligase [Luteimonas sp.]